MSDLNPGDIVWVSLDPTIGREQSGVRPVVVVSGTDYLETVDSLAIVLPITSRDRGWPNHVPVLGSELDRPSWVMTEQLRTISRKRIVGQAGNADKTTMRAIRVWMSDFLEL